MLFVMVYFLYAHYIENVLYEMVTAFLRYSYILMKVVARIKEWWTMLLMVIGSCAVKLSLVGVGSLKEKRRILKSLLARLPQKFNVAVAEVDYQDVWQTALIGLVTVGNDGGYLHGVLEKSVAWIEQARPDVPIESYYIELL